MENLKKGGIKTIKKGANKKMEEKIKKIKNQAEDKPMIKYPKMPRFDKVTIKKGEKIFKNRQIVIELVERGFILTLKSIESSAFIAKRYVAEDINSLCEILCEFDYE